MRFTKECRSIVGVVTVAWLLAHAGPAMAAVVMSVSPSAPAVNPPDIAQLDGDHSGGDIAGGDGGNIWGNRPVQGQSFLTGDNPAGYLLNAVTFRNFSNTTTSGLFALRVGAISGNVLTPVATETAANTVSYVPGDFITATFDTPVWLMPNQLYGVDWGSTGSGFITTNNLDVNSYPDGAAYSSGSDSVPGATLDFHAADRVFHLAMEPAAQTPWLSPGQWISFDAGGTASTHNANSAETVGVLGDGYWNLPYDLNAAYRESVGREATGSWMGLKDADGAQTTVGFSITGPGYHQDRERAASGMTGGLWNGWFHEGAGDPGPYEWDFTISGLDPDSDLPYELVMYSHWGEWEQVGTTFIIGDEVKTADNSLDSEGWNAPFIEGTNYVRFSSLMPNSAGEITGTVTGPGKMRWNGWQLYQVPEPGTWLLLLSALAWGLLVRRRK